MSLPQKGHVQAEYVWIDAAGNCRCKTKVCTCSPIFCYTVNVVVFRIVNSDIPPMQLNVPALSSLQLAVHVTRSRKLTGSLQFNCRPSRSPSRRSMNSPNGTLTVRRLVRPTAKTRMFTFVPSTSSPTPSVRARTSLFCAKPGIRMVLPTSSTSVTMPTA